MNLLVRLRPVAFILVLLVIWQIAISSHPGQLLPGPWQTLRGIGDLLQHGLLLKYVVASLFRVTWGFLLAAVIAIPLGLAIGWYRRAEMAFNPLVANFSSDFAAGVDSDRHPLVWSRRPLRDFPDLRRLLLFSAADRHERGSQHSRRLHQRGSQLRLEHPRLSSIAFYIPPSRLS